MNAPESTSPAALAQMRAGPLPTAGPRWWALVAVVSAATAALTMVSVQHGCALTIVILGVGLYVRSRLAGMAALWLTWLLAPWLRRIFLLTEATEGPEPLSLTPFLLTAAIVALELRQVHLSSRTRGLLLMVASGFALGLPLGLLVAPAAAVFALFAYVTGVGCIVIGYREASEGRLALPGLLMLVVPLVAVYAIAQYYLPLPEWDHVWRETADINSVGSGEEGRVRVWGTLNSPGAFAGVLAVTAVTFVALSRTTLPRLAGALLVFGALALTYVRSAWLGVLVGVLVVMLVTRGRAIVRVGAVVVLLAALAPVVVGGSTGAALDDRVDSFGQLDQDTSVQQRIQTPLLVVPLAVDQPLGLGIGRAGEATRLSGGVGFRYTDNTFLSLLWQVGPIGFLLVIAGVAMGMNAALRNAFRTAEPIDVLTAGVAAYYAVTMFAGDQLFGIGGMIFWYTTGVAMRRRELQAERQA